MATVPTTEIIGPSGRLVCNTSDVEMFRAKGYKPIDEIPEEEPQKSKPLEEMKVPELKELAAELEIEEAGGKAIAQALKADLIEAIKAKQQESDDEDTNDQG